MGLSFTLTDLDIYATPYRQLMALNTLNTVKTVGKYLEASGGKLTAAFEDGIVTHENQNDPKTAYFLTESWVTGADGKADWLMTVKLDGKCYLVTFMKQPPKKKSFFSREKGSIEDSHYVAISVATVAEPERFLKKRPRTVPKPIAMGGHRALPPTPGGVVNANNPAVMANPASTYATTPAHVPAPQHLPREEIYMN